MSLITGGAGLPLDGSLGRDFCGDVSLPCLLLGSDFEDGVLVLEGFPGTGELDEVDVPVGRPAWPEG